jgi:hypothetical protein
MNSIAFQDRPSISDPDQDFRYRSLSKPAVASLTFAILGLSSFLHPVFVLLPTLGVGFGLIALASFRRFPDEFVGKIPAQIGFFVSLICLVSSVGMHAVIYATEVPEGYQRIAYSTLRDNPKTSLPFAEKAKELDGEKVFLKGYVRPGAKKTNLKDFILVGDFGDCCFGGNPKITEVVAIHIVDEDKTVNYGFALRRIAGVFRLNPNTKSIREKDIPQVFYEIEADYVK